PQVTFDFMVTNRVVDLVGENVDLSLRIGPLDDSGLVSRKIRDLRRVVCESQLSRPAWLAGRTCRPRSPRLSRLEPEPRLGALAVSGERQAGSDRRQRSRQRRQRGYVAAIGNRRSGHPAAKRTRGGALHPLGAAEALAAGRTRSGALPASRP